MFNMSLIWLLFLPITLSLIGHHYVLPNMPIRRVRPSDYWFITVISILVGVLVTMGVFYYARGTLTSDTEFLNGSITSKDRHHGSYQEAYSCNCRQQCTGSGQSASCSTVCDTCYTDHYTVEWSAISNVGKFRIAKLDETSSSVYDTPDPVRYQQTMIGEPCSVSHSYVNYIKAVPQSLFRPAAGDLKQKFGFMIPPYPDHIHDLWKARRVLALGVNVPNITEWNNDLSEVLAQLGPIKHVNAVVVLVKTNDPNYAYALQDAWVNGKKNDVIVIIGTTNFPERANWVRVLALTDSEGFKIRLRDDLLALEKLTSEDIIGAMKKNIFQLYKRKSMKDFAYLDAEIDPPIWILTALVLFISFSFMTFWWWLSRGGSSSTLGSRRFY